MRLKAFGLGILIAATLSACNGLPPDQRAATAQNQNCAAVTGSHLSCRTNASQAQSTTDTHALEQASRNIGVKGGS